ncbi:hypothetical protein AAHZ94_06645 [Streptomyces sp. HSW2009]|uniref:hypothetical protein n=1 Tax=Streptomyces sp. HSW2009 TaxID=3142890 RepID=UPI0032EB743C
MAEGQVDLPTILTLGENTFTAKYRAGGSGTARFQNRFIVDKPAARQSLRVQGPRDQVRQAPAEARGIPARAGPTLPHLRR